jgi:hypothetical protein
MNNPDDLAKLIDAKLLALEERIVECCRDFLRRRLKREPREIEVMTMRRRVAEIAQQQSRPVIVDQISGNGHEKPDAIDQHG